MIEPREGRMIGSFVEVSSINTNIDFN
jgi:hypothetical protein